MGYLKIRAKELMLGCTVRLFCVSLISFVLRYGVLFGLGAALYFGGFEEIRLFLIGGNTFWRSVALGLALWAARLVILIFISGVRMGEQSVYFGFSRSGCFRFAPLFSSLSPKKAAKAFIMYSLLYTLRLLWLLYFLLPGLLMGGITVFLYLRNLPFLAVVILTAAVSVLIVLGLYCFFFAAARYRSAVYLFWKGTAKTPVDAVRQSAKNADSSLGDTVFLRLTLGAWALPGLLIIPLLYIVPYLRLTCALESGSTMAESEAF